MIVLSTYLLVAMEYISAGIMNSGIRCGIDSRIDKRADEGDGEPGVEKESGCLIVSKGQPEKK